MGYLLRRSSEGKVYPVRHEYRNRSRILPSTPTGGSLVLLYIVQGGGVAHNVPGVNLSDIAIPTSKGGLHNVVKCRTPYNFWSAILYPPPTHTHTHTLE
jgi:hypothetical protein